MALDARYFVSIDLEEYFPSNLTGNALANGSIWFYQDINRTNPKPVYELTGAPPNYTYTALPNPLPLSAVGTPVDNSGNNISIYYFPYDASGNIDLYYIVVKDANGTVQFTRQAWPNLTGATNPATADSDISNELTNPQFVEVNFALSNPMTISIAGSGTTTSSIAPGWDLITTTTGASNITVQRNAIAGSSAYPNNPPYTLTITPGLNVSQIYLRQRLLNNPDVFSPQTAGTTNGYVSASILLAPSSSVLSIQYQPNGQTAQTILTANNTSGLYSQYNATVQLLPATNPSTGDTGYVDFLVNLPTVGSTTFSSLQLVGLNSNIPTVNFDQTTANRQRDQLFNYYENYLAAKQIPSYLVGWNFPQNPAQFLGPTIAASSAGANTSAYVWDQTVLFQSANSGAAVSRASSGALRITATNATQFALIQYLPQADARLILNRLMSVNVAALTPQTNGIVGTVGLYYTTDGSLPSTGSNNSIVATLNSTGGVATFHGNWSAVPRSGLGPAQFTVGSSSTTNFNDYGLNGWDMAGISACNTATFFAIVVGFATLNAAGTIDIGSISLVPGNIPCRPGAQSDIAVLTDCQYYYQKSFNVGTVPAQNLGLGTGEYYGGGTDNPGGIYYMIKVLFSVSMRVAPSITIYDPALADAFIYDLTVGNSFGNSTALNISQNQCVLTTSGAGGSAAHTVAAHWTADARLGL
jgi:hypothetical protein